MVIGLLFRWWLNQLTSPVKANKYKEDTAVKKHSREQIRYTMREITLREQIRIAKLLRLHRSLAGRHGEYI